MTTCEVVDRHCMLIQFDRRCLNSESSEVQTAALLLRCGQHGDLAELDWSRDELHRTYQRYCCTGRDRQRVMYFSTRVRGCAGLRHFSALRYMCLMG